MSKPIKVEYEGKLVPAIDLDFNSEREPWTVYKLEDGTILRFKQAMAKVSRLTENFKDDGEPIYIFQMATVSHVEAPDDLKKKKVG